MLKCVGKNGGQALRHVSPAIVWRKRVVAEIRGAETAADNLADMDDAGKFVLFGDDPVAEMRFSTEPFQCCVEFGGSVRGGCPFPMKCFTPSDGSQEFFATSAGRLLEMDLICHAMLRMLELFGDWSRIRK